MLREHGLQFFDVFRAEFVFQGAQQIGQQADLAHHPYRLVGLIEAGEQEQPGQGFAGGVRW